MCILIYFRNDFSCQDRKWKSLIALPEMCHVQSCPQIAHAFQNVPVKILSARKIFTKKKKLLLYILDKYISYVAHSYAWIISFT